MTEVMRCSLAPEVGFRRKSYSVEPAMVLLLRAAVRSVYFGSAANWSNTVPVGTTISEDTQPVDNEWTTGRQVIDHSGNKDANG